MSIGTVFTLFVTPMVYTFLARDHAAFMAREGRSGIWPRRSWTRKGAGHAVKDAAAALPMLKRASAAVAGIQAAPRLA